MPDLDRVQRIVSDTGRTSLLSYVFSQICRGLRSVSIIYVTLVSFRVQCKGMIATIKLK